MSATRPAPRTRGQGAKTSDASPISPRLAVFARRALVAYIIVWGVEGAIRKWIPGTDQLLYVARDLTLAVCLVMVAILSVRRRPTAWWPIFWASALVLFCLAMVGMIRAGYPPLVAITGIRNYLAPVMILAFVATSAPLGVLDLAKRTISWLVLANLPIVILQVLSPPEAPINHEVVSDAAHFVNNGVVRASGLYSAPAGLSALVALALAVALGEFFRRGGRVWLHGAAAGAAIAIVALGGARSNVLAMAITFAALVWIVVARNQFRLLGRLLISALALTSLMAGIAMAFPQVLDSFSLRFEQAAASEDSLERLIRQAFGFLSEDFTLLGNGPGANSTAAVSSGATAPTEWAETETIRWVVELGLLGYALAAARLVIVAGLLIHFMLNARHRSPTLLLVSVTIATSLLYGSLTTQPSTQGALGIALALHWLETANERGGLAVGQLGARPNGNPSRSQWSHRQAVQPAESHHQFTRVRAVHASSKGG